MLYKIFRYEDKASAKEFALENKGRVLASTQVQNGYEYWAVIYSEGEHIDFETYEYNWKMSEMRDVNSEIILELARKLKLYGDVTYEESTKINIAESILNNNIQWAYSCVYGNVWMNIDGKISIRLVVDGVRYNDGEVVSEDVYNITPPIGTIDSLTLNNQHHEDPNF